MMTSQEAFRPIMFVRLLDVIIIGVIAIELRLLRGQELAVWGISFPSNYGLQRENTFQHPWIILSGTGIKQRQMRYLLCRASTTTRSADNLWTSVYKLYDEVRF